MNYLKIIFITFSLGIKQLTKNLKLFSEQASDAAKVAQAKIYQTQKLANQVAKQMEVSASLFTRTDEDSSKINF